MLKTVSSCAYDYKTVEEITKFKKIEKFSLGLTKIDKIFGFPCGFYLITGIAGSSKSFFATWLARKFWEKYNVRSLFFSLEMTESKLRQRILQQWSDLTYDQFSAGQSKKNAVTALQEGAISIMYLEKVEQKIAFVEEKIKEASDLGYWVVFFDHLNELTGMNDERNKTVADQWATFWAEMVKKYPHMHFFVLAQPNKMAFKQKILTQDNIKGSNVFAERADYFLSINRAKCEDEFKETTFEDRSLILWLDKTRNTDTTHIGFRLFFEQTGNYVEQ